MTRFPRASLRLAGLLLFTAASACGGPSAASKLHEAPAALSGTFTGNCANCHGSKGEGSFGPALATVAYADFVSAVRNGKNGVMPMFDTATYSDQDLKADFTALTGKPAQ